MKKLTPAQRKALSDFANMIAAAWFTAGIISPFFNKPKSNLELIYFVSVGIVMTFVALYSSLSIVKEIKV